MFKTGITNKNSTSNKIYKYILNTIFKLMNKVIKTSYHKHFSLHK